MNRNLKTTLFILIIILTAGALKAQQTEINYDTLVAGKRYEVIINNGWEAEGLLISNDSASIELMTKLKTFTIPKKEIKEIIGANMNFQFGNNDIGYSRVQEQLVSLSAGTGVHLQQMPFYGNGEYLPGINFQISLITKTNRSTALRLGLEYARSPKKTNEYRYNASSGEYYGKSEGGHLNSIDVQFQLLFGNLNTTSKMNSYFILGTGINFLNTSTTTSTSTYPSYDPITKSYTTQHSVYSYKEKPFNYVPVDVGGGLIVKVAKDLKIYGELQYSLPALVLAYSFAYPGFLLAGSPSLKLGVQMDL